MYMCYVECHIKQMNLSVETHKNWGGGGKGRKKNVKKRGGEGGAGEKKKKE